MVSGIVTVGRKQYASGLYWENSPTGRVSQAAREAARQPGNQSDFYVVRLGNKQGRVPQFGLAPPTEGFRAGIPSLAGCLANQQPGSWLGAFRLREGTALVVVRDDLIVPDGDVFFMDETEARDRLFQEMAIGGFQRIYAPEAWGVPGADTMPISLLLNDRTDVRLRSVSLSTQSKVVLAIGIALVLLLLGVGWNIQQERERAEALRLQQLEALKRLRTQASRITPGLSKPEYPPPERKWEKRPEPLKYIEACHKALEKVSLAVAGWRLSGATCSEKALSLTWARTGGFSAPPPNSMVTPNGTSAVSSYPLTKLEPRGDQNLVDPEVITKRYLGQNWTGSLSRIPDDPPPPPPPNYTGEWNPPPPPWVKRSFTLTVPVLPWTLTTFFSDLPGVIVTSIALSGSRGSASQTWTLKGEIYENRR